MLNCRQVTELAGERLDGKLSLKRRLEIQLHLMICMHCRRYQRHYQRSQQVAKNIAAKLWQTDPKTIAEVKKKLDQTR